MIDVTAAVVIEDGKILICQRPEGKSCAHLWEFPGGKQEPGESLQQCLQRELLEELDLQVSDMTWLRTIERPEAGLRLHFFLCRPENQPSPNEHEAILWVRPNALKQYSFCPSDSELLVQSDPAQWPAWLADSRLH